MLLYQSLNFYPPVNAHDYSVYLIPDGIPPLASTVYWWIYSAVGKPLMQATAISVALQLLSAMGLTFFATFYAFGRRAAYFSLVAFATSTLLLSAFAIGQETGYTALAVAGQFCFTWAAVRRPGLSPIIAAAFFAVLGALARDYGPALTVSGFLVLAWHPRTRRFLPIFTALVLALSAPWYLRNWAITGNPLFPHAIPGGSPVNDVFAATQNSWHEELSFYKYGFPEWINLSGVLLFGGPLAILGGIWFGLCRLRSAGPLVITALIMVGLWLISMGETAGGPVYSMRVLTPAWISLVILAGAAGAHIHERSGRLNWGLRLSFLVAVLCCSLYAVAFSLSYPFTAKDTVSAITSSYAGPPDFCAQKVEAAGILQKSALPATGLLTSSAYMGTILQRETRFRPVMIWSPEVDFVFDKTLKPSEIRQRLLSRNIKLVALDDNWGNNIFLSQFPFYQTFIQKGTGDEFKVVSVVGNEAVVLLLPENSTTDLVQP